MTDRIVAVRGAPKGDELTNEREHCSMDPGTLVAIGAAVREQVRITRPDGGRALYTVSSTRDETPDDVVRMGLTGRRRLGQDGVFDAVASASILRSDLNDGEAKESGEFVERLCDGGGRDLIVVAPHGGDIEPHTDEQAERVLARFPAGRVSAWLCRGWRPGGAGDAWHITSGDLNPASFPLLDQVIGRGFAHAVSFHGFTPPDVLVGGAAPKSLRQEIADAITAATAGSGLVVRVAEPGDPLGGDDTANVVNRLTRDEPNGVQIEQSPKARKHWREIADAVADVYARLLSGAPAQT